MNEKNEKDRAMEEAMKQINKKYGSRAIIKMDGSEKTNIEAISTGCFSLDYIFGCGGIPVGRITEIFGNEGSGKSVMAMFMIAQAQKQGLRVAWVDSEFSFNTFFASTIGVDVSKLILNQPTTGEEALDVVDKLASTNSLDIIVVDSVAALVPQKELEGEILDQGMALQARMMSKALRVITGNLSRTKTAVIFINQLRERIGIFWGPKELTAGGKALRFYSSVRLEVKKGKNIVGENNEVIGNHLTVKAVKNKVGLPWRTVELELIFRKGINLSSALLEAALIRGVIKKVGSTYSLGEEKIAVGHDATAKEVEDKPELYKKINEALIGWDKQNQNVIINKPEEEKEADQEVKDPIPGPIN